MIEWTALLWYDDSPTTLTQKVARAANRHTRKHGVIPNLCYVHLTAMDGEQPLKLGAVTVAPLRTVLKHCFWIGKKEEKKDGE